MTKNNGVVPKSLITLQINKRFFETNHFPIKGVILSHKYEGKVIFLPAKEFHNTGLLQIIVSGFLNNKKMNEELYDEIASKFPSNINGIHPPELAYAYFLATKGEISILNGSSDSLNKKMNQAWPNITIEEYEDWAGIVIISPADLTILKESQKQALKKYEEQLKFIHNITPIEVLMVPSDTDKENIEYISLSDYYEKINERKKGK